MGAPVDVRIADTQGKITPPWAEWAKRIDAAAFARGGGGAGGGFLEAFAGAVASGGADEALAELASFMPTVPPAGPPAPARRLEAPFVPFPDDDPTTEALAAFASFHGPSVRALELPQIDASTGTVNQFVPTSSLVYLTNAADLTINGILAGYDGQTVTFVAKGTNPAYFNPQNGGASAVDRLINRFANGYTPIAVNGAATYNYDAATQRWRLVRHAMGGFIDIPFASCVYDSNTGAFWTVVAGDIAVQRYTIVDKTLILVVSINSTTTTLAGVGTRLRIDFSAVSGWTWDATTRSFARVVDGGAAQLGMATGGAAGVAIVQFSHDVADTAWGVGVNRGMNGITLLLGLT